MVSSTEAKRSRREAAVELGRMVQAAPHTHAPSHPDEDGAAGATAWLSCLCQGDLVRGAPEGVAELIIANMVGGHHTAQHACAVA